MRDRTREFLNEAREIVSEVEESNLLKTSRKIIVAPLYYACYYCSLAMLYELVPEVREKIDAGAKIKHQGALKYFHHYFIGKDQIYSLGYECYDIYKNLLKERERTSYECKQLLPSEISAHYAGTKTFLMTCLRVIQESDINNEVYWER